MPVGYYDPDWSSGGGQKRPSWATPKTKLAQDALAICGRKYFHGQTKHLSEFSDWDKIEQRTMGADEDSFLYKMWVMSCMEWAKKMNIKGIVITFGTVLKMINNDENKIDFIAKNKERLLKERKQSVPNFAGRININASVEAEKSDD